MLFVFILLKLVNFLSRVHAQSNVMVVQPITFIDFLEYAIIVCEQNDFTAGFWVLRIPGGFSDLTAEN